jgi:hypothetical protein
MINILQPVTRYCMRNLRSKYALYFGAERVIDKLIWGILNRVQISVQLNTYMVATIECIALNYTHL